MTERKPPGISFTSWIDQQIDEAAERGAFDNLPGAGQPIPKRPEPDDGQAWLRDYLRREGVSAEELLPTSLRLRKEVERLTGTVQELRCEQEVREVVSELNRRIIQWRRIPVGPPVFLPLVDEEAMVGRWRDARSPASVSSPAPAGQQASDSDPPRPRWWHRRRHRRRHLLQPTGTAGRQSRRDALAGGAAAGTCTRTAQRRCAPSSARSAALRAILRQGIAACASGPTLG
jgi:Domain of unknown function (DUF1992)